MKNIEARPQVALTSLAKHLWNKNVFQIVLSCQGNDKKNLTPKLPFDQWSMSSSQASMCAKDSSKFGRYLDQIRRNAESTSTLLKTSSCSFEISGNNFSINPTDAQLFKNSREMSLITWGFWTTTDWRYSRKTLINCGPSWILHLWQL